MALSLFAPLESQRGSRQNPRLHSLALAVVGSSTAPLVLLDGDLKVIAASASFFTAFQINPLPIWLWRRNSRSTPSRPPYQRRGAVSTIRTTPTTSPGWLGPWCRAAIGWLRASRSSRSEASNRCCSSQKIARRSCQ